MVTSCGDPITINKKIVTGEASHISCRNAVISGKASIKETASTDLTFGVLYSTNSGVLIGTATQVGNENNAYGNRKGADKRADANKVLPEADPYA